MAPLTMIGTINVKIITLRINIIKILPFVEGRDILVMKVILPKLVRAISLSS